MTTSTTGDSDFPNPLGLALTDQLGLVVGRAYPATGAAPVIPSPAVTLALHGAQRLYTQDDMDARDRKIAELRAALRELWRAQDPAAWDEQFAGEVSALCKA